MNETTAFPRVATAAAPHIVAAQPPPEPDIGPALPPS